MSRSGGRSSNRGFHEAVRRYRAHYKGLSYSAARQQVSKAWQQDWQDTVNRVRAVHPELSNRQADQRARQSFRILNRPIEEQSDRERTWALRELGRIEKDEFYRNGVLVGG